MEDGIRIGIIGAGAIVASHLTAIREHRDRLHPCGVCDPDPARRSALASELGVPGFAAAGELLDAQRPDVVLIATPHDLHAELSIAAMDAGAHVVVEKPMANSQADCRQMIATAQRTGKQLLVADTAAYAPGAALTGRRFSNGDLGAFLTGGSVNLRYYFDSTRPEWFLDPHRSGGGMFANLGLHRLATSRRALKGLRPISVSACIRHLSQWQVEACTTAIVRYEPGQAFTYEEVGYMHRPAQMPGGCHYIFENGIVTWDQSRWRLSDVHGCTHEEPLPPDPGYRPIYQAMLECLAGGGPAEYDMLDAGEDVAMVQAAYLSARMGRDISLTELPRLLIETGSVHQHVASPPRSRADTP